MVCTDRSQCERSWLKIRALHLIQSEVRLCYELAAGSSTMHPRLWLHLHCIFSRSTLLCLLGNERVVASGVTTKACRPDRDIATNDRSYHHNCNASDTLTMFTFRTLPNVQIAPYQTWYKPGHMGTY
jgi:hypothetical protein